MQISRPLWASKPECDAHICLNLGFAPQNFRLTQVSPHVCYFWSSPFRMDNGSTLLVSIVIADLGKACPHPAGTVHEL